jgi:hypothetical protein
MVARVAAASKYREKCKKPEKPILVGDPKDFLPCLCATVQIRKFLRATGFCQIWIPNYSVLAKPLYNTTKWGEWEPILWREKQTNKKAFKKLRGHSQTPLLWAC